MSKVVDPINVLSLDYFYFNSNLKYSGSEYLYGNFFSLQMERTILCAYSSAKAKELPFGLKLIFIFIIVENNDLNRLQHSLIFNQIFKPEFYSKFAKRSMIVSVAWQSKTSELYFQRQLAHWYIIWIRVFCFASYQWNKFIFQSYYCSIKNTNLDKS